MQRMSNGKSVKDIREKYGLPKTLPKRKSTPKKAAPARRPGMTRDLPAGGRKPAGPAARRPLPSRGGATPARRPVPNRKPGGMAARRPVPSRRPRPMGRKPGMR